MAAPVYEVTATRRRPKTFDELAGQEFVVSTLKNSLQNGQIAHAYLFSGPRGCGKTSAARILARSLNCEKGLGGGAEGSAGPCGACDNCLAIRAGSSMDVIEIDGASNTSVNDVRQIKDEVLFPPQSGTYKIYIIDEVHMLSNSAFNALLKTIEEPPPYIIFIFATTELHKVPATIKSRCQQFSFRLIPIETIQGILKSVCAEMGIQAEDSALFWIAKESTGSMRDAFTLFDQVASFSGGHIREALIREKLGLAGLEKINQLAEACAGGDAAEAFALIDAALSAGVAIEQLIIDLAGYYRSLLLIKNGITRESLLGYSPSEFSAKALEALDPIRLEQALEILLDCYRDIRYSVSPRFELETAVSKLSWLGKWVSPEELRLALEEAQAALQAQPGAGGAGGMPRPLAPGGASHAGSRPPAPAREESRQGSHITQDEQALSDGLRRILAEKKGPARAEAQGGDDDDEPVWSGVLRRSGAGPDAAAPAMAGAAESSSLGAAPTDTAPPNTAPPAEESPVDRVLRLIPGAVIN